MNLSVRRAHAEALDRFRTQNAGNVLSFLLGLAKRRARCPSDPQIAAGAGLNSESEAAACVRHLEEEGSISIQPHPRGRFIWIPDGKATWLLGPPPEVIPVAAYPSLAEAVEGLRRIGDMVEQLESNPAMFRLNDYPRPVPAEAILRRAAHKRAYTTIGIPFEKR